MTLRVAMIGSRGVPATYGGIERHVEEIGARIVGRGHDVTVYCRTNYVGKRPASHRGMRLRYLPTISTKSCDAIVHSAISTIHALGSRYDVVHYHALGPGICAALPRYLGRAKVVETIHGLDSERAKWGRVARIPLRLAVHSSARVPHATIVVSKDLEQYYATRFGRATEHIVNGVGRPRGNPGLGALGQRLGIRPGSYVLSVGRIVPEKAPGLLIEAFRQVPGDLRLVIAGGSSFTAGYTAEVAALAAEDPRVVLAGFVYGDELAALYREAACFALPSLLEGLPLTLLEAVAHGAPVVASSIPPHLEVLGGEGPGRRICRPGDLGSLRDALLRSLADHEAEVGGAAELTEDVLARYDWDVAAERTEAVYRRICAIEAGTGAEPPAPVPASG